MLIGNQQQPAGHLPTEIAGRRLPLSHCRHALDQIPESPGTSDE
jgi:hypothetical protein